MYSTTAIFSKMYIGNALSELINKESNGQQAFAL